MRGTIPTPPTPGLATPRQARSRRTLERLLAATTRLLDNHTFDALTIARIVGEAGSSVGAFYARFADKDALLDVLDEEYAEGLLELGDRCLEELDAAHPAELAATVRFLFSRLVPFHRERRGLIRALVLRARSRLEPSYRARTRRMNRLTPEIVRRLLRHRGEIIHPDAAGAARRGFAMAYTAMRERILFPESFEMEPPATDVELVEDLVCLLTGYLGLAGRPMGEAS